MKVFIVDVGICNGCYGCQFACKDEHVGNDWAPIAKPQPDTGQFWMRVDEHIRGTVPQVRMHYVPNPCTHCDEAPCIASCPIEGAIYKRDDGLVIIDTDKCTGCKVCVDTCPYHSIYFNDDLQPGAEVHRLRPPARRRLGGPALRRLVPDRRAQVRRGERVRRAHRQGRGHEARARHQAARVLPEHPEEVHRRHRVRPGREGGRDRRHRARPRRPAAATPSPSTTDDFGDFWLKGLETGVYEVTIAADGFATKTFETVRHREGRQPRRHPALAVDEQRERIRRAVQPARRFHSVERDRPSCAGGRPSDRPL